MLSAVPALIIAPLPSPFQSRITDIPGTVRLGGPVPSPSEDPVELARTHRKLGYRAASCPRVTLEDKDKIRAIEKAFRAEDVLISEVGAFGFNMMARDPAERKKSLEAMCQRLALADEVGANCCVNIAGYLGKDQNDRTHPDNLSKIALDLTVENIRYILDSVRPKRARFALEMMAWIIPDSPDSYVNLVRAVDRPGFAVHLDPVNIINSPRRYFDNATLLQECFTKLGQWIVSCHAKDTVLTGESVTHIHECRPGTGRLDYRVFLRGVAGLPTPAGLIMEHLRTPEEYDLARKYIVAVGNEIGISF